MDVGSVAVLEVENDSPILADGHGPEALQAAHERVQPKTGNIERPGDSAASSAERRRWILPRNAALIRLGSPLS
jgi:hypothetical protein